MEEFLEVILPTYHEMRKLRKICFNTFIVRRFTGELVSQWLHWERISRLHSLVKAVRLKCWGCKRLQAITPPIPGQLPKDRTSVGTVFEIIVDFAGPIKYRKSSKTEEKAYLAIFTCSLCKPRDRYIYHVFETIYCSSWTFARSLSR